MADALGAITVSGNPAVEAVLSGSTGAIETAVAQAATATVASAATRAAAARYFDEQTLVVTQEFLAAKAVAALTTKQAVEDAAEYAPDVGSTLPYALRLHQLAYPSIASPMKGGEALKRHLFEMLQLHGL